MTSMAGRAAALRKIVEAPPLQVIHLHLVEHHDEGWAAVSPGARRTRRATRPRSSQGQVSRGATWSVGR